ncbi:hypothetical protein [Neoaquamicrobium sediminum]|uniref:hypothetical protein n=1 Tax=Neoaquamicrobium sediminum TaxID=1849104 RepID=UPI001567B137|nr:hypothetical protein [Mesorhizobium sediminum]NRC54144.1 hypothetical protein [Mesorhizobium sediminum]
MASTLAHTIDEEWTLVATGMRNVAIQLSRQGQFEVHVADSEPDESAVGIEIGNTLTGMPSTFAIAALGESTSVWVRSVRGAQIVVLAY